MEVEPQFTSEVAGAKRPVLGGPHAKGQPPPLPAFPVTRHGTGRDFGTRNPTPLGADWFPFRAPPFRPRPQALGTAARQAGRACHSVGVAEVLGTEPRPLPPN